MCGMFFTFNQNNIELLSKQNAKRGGIRETLTTVNLNGNDLFVGHFQAPTSENSGTQPHVINNKDFDFCESSLWHNGLLKESQIEELYKLYYQSKSNWDTELLHHAILNQFDLSDIDGSFAVFQVTTKTSIGAKNFREMNFARNALAPLFINEETKEVSSVKIKELGIIKPVEHGTWFSFFEKDGEIADISQWYDVEYPRFTTRNNPYDI